MWTGADGFDYQIARLTDALLPQLPHWLDANRIYGFESADPDAQPVRQFFAEIQRPAMISFIASHGALDEIWTSFPDAESSSISRADVRKALDQSSPLGPLFILACESGRFDSGANEGDSLAETFLVQRGGPIAVVASTGTTHAMTNYLFARLMLDEIHTLPNTLGEFLLGIQRAASNTEEASFADLALGDELAEYFIDSFDASLAIHHRGRFHFESQSYNLLGDPAISFATQRQ